MTDHQTAPELIEASRAKMEAETLAALALARKNDAEARKAEVEAESQLEYVANQRMQNEVGLMGLEQSRRLRLLELAQDSHHHIYRFTSQFDDSSCQKLISWLTSEVRLAAGDETKPTITVEFYSPGGSVFAGMALYDHIQWVRSQGHEVITSAVGYAASMGGILLQAGDVRRMGREAYVMIHEVATGVRGKLSDIKDEAKFLEKMENRVLTIFAERSAAAHKANPDVCKKPLTKKQFLEKQTKTDWWLSSDECLLHGIVDEVF